MLVRPNLISERDTSPRFLGDYLSIGEPNFSKHISQNGWEGCYPSKEIMKEGGIYNNMDNLDNVGYIAAGGANKTDLDFLEEFRE